MAVHPYLAADRDVDRKLLLKALGLAAALHVVLLTIDLPGRAPAPAPPPEPEGPRIVWTTPEPPEVAVDRIRRTAETVEPRRPIPVPDAGPQEPLAEAAAIEVRWEADPDVEPLVLGVEPPSRPSGPLRPTEPGVTLPLLIPESKVQPSYPEPARRARIDGQVTLEAVILADGTVGEIEILLARPEGLGFEEAAIEAVRQWRYRPATLGGRPVAIYFTVHIRFELN